VRLERFAYGGGMRGVPWWGVVSSAAAPVLMAGGWTVAAGLQPRFDPVAGTVSALAAQGASDRWVMTLTFVVVGVCYVVTALALRPAGTAGRLILITGAVAGMLVAANPERAGDAYPWGHIIWASIGLAGVTAWPAGAWRRGTPVPWGLRPAVAAAAVAVLLALVMWFGAELITGSGQAGLAERAAGTAQALWPLAVVISCCRPVRVSAIRSGTRGPAGRAGNEARRVRILQAMADIAPQCPEVRLALRSQINQHVLCRFGCPRTVRGRGHRRRPIPKKLSIPSR
jgi:hypothetical membrane protein